MGLTDNTPRVPFTRADVLNKDLVIRMLQFEEQYTFSKAGQDLYRNPLNEPLRKLFVEKTLNRITLSHFGYSTDDSSVSTFRTIFRTYFKSVANHDVDVMDSIHYFRGNKVVFYTQPIINIGDQLPDCRILAVGASQSHAAGILAFGAVGSASCSNGAGPLTETTVHAQLNGCYTLIQPFSMS